MSMIQVTNLTFGYEGNAENIFENATFCLDTSWRTGFIGRNGRGKTTFLNLLQGKYEYLGNITHSTTFKYFPFEIIDEGKSCEEIAREIAPEHESWQLIWEIAKLELEESVLSRPFNTLSMGERNKLMLACLFLNDEGFLLIDEPTNHLDMHAREVVGEYLRGKNGFLLVSHDRHFLDLAVDHILSINRASIEVLRGIFSSWQQNKILKDERKKAENEQLKRDINRLNIAAKRAEKRSNTIEDSKIGNHVGDRGYLGHKAAKMMKRGKALELRAERAVEEKSKLLTDLEEAQTLKLYPLERSGFLLELKDITIKYGKHTACENVSFTLTSGQRLAIIGKNGSGKSSLLKLIMGEDISYTGTFYKPGNLKMSYVSQDTSFLRGNLLKYAEEQEIDTSLFLAVLRQLDFSRSQFEIEMERYSEGQKKKVLLASSLCDSAHIYVWDEPLNFIDVMSRVQIEKLILAHNPTLLFVEHDKHFSSILGNDWLQL